MKKTNMAPKEMYIAFFKAMKGKKGELITTRINGVNSKVYLLYIHGSRFIINLSDLENLPIFQVKTTSGRKLDLKEIANIDEAKKSMSGNPDFLRSLKNMGKQCSDDMKGSAMEKLQAMRAVKTIHTKAKPKPKIMFVKPKLRA